MYNKVFDKSNENGKTQAHTLSFRVHPRTISRARCKIEHSSVSVTWTCCVRAAGERWISSFENSRIVSGCQEFKLKHIVNFFKTCNCRNIAVVCGAYLFHFIPFVRTGRFHIDFITDSKNLAFYLIRCLIKKKNGMLEPLVPCARSSTRI